MSLTDDEGRSNCHPARRPRVSGITSEA